MNKFDKDIENIKESIDDLLLLSDFLIYNSLDKSPKKIKKKLEKLKKCLDEEDFEKCMNEEWLSKYENY